MTTDPFLALFVPDEPMEPRPQFRAELRRLLEAIENTAKTPAPTPLQRSSMPAQASWLYYFTLPTSDTERARVFYTGLFPDWQVDLNPDEGGFHVANVQPPMGVGTNTGQHTRLWFVVPEIAAAVGAVRAAGGAADDPVRYDSGWSADCRDDQGMHFSLSEPAYESAPISSTKPGELFYFNLPTPDDEQGKRFYSAVFGWEFGEYTGTHITNTAPEGGLGGYQKGAHPEVWFRVANLDGALEKVRELGGAGEFIGEGPEGRHAWCTDDQGFGFGVSEPSAMH